MKNWQNSNCKKKKKNSVTVKRDSDISISLQSIRPHPWKNLIWRSDSTLRTRTMFILLTAVSLAQFLVVSSVNMFYPCILNKWKKNTNSRKTKHDKKVFVVLIQKKNISPWYFSPKHSITKDNFLGKLSEFVSILVQEFVKTHDFKN